VARTNSHEPIISAIDEQKPTALHIDDARVDQRPRLLRIVHEVVVVLVAKLFRQGGQRVPRVLVHLGLFEPLAAEEVVGAGALADGAGQAVGVGVGDADLWVGRVCVSSFVSFRFVLILSALKSGLGC